MKKQTRVTYGSNEIHSINDMPEAAFVATRPKGDDVFIRKNGTAVVTVRMENLIWHGLSSKNMDMTGVTKVWCGREQIFVAPEDFGKLLHSVYCGRKSRIKPIK